MLPRGARQLPGALEQRPGSLVARLRIHAPRGDVRGEGVELPGQIVLAREPLRHPRVVALVLRVAGEVVHDGPVEPGAWVFRVTPKPLLE